ncbi:uncharacterized protein LOC110024579 [Phalaenopsis equestris]|uniref:uncharacterized protein LOC110024579 n=1 Tax=Phalaenopsis equestris TaxID=78828 RepID=UPI0009E1D971|nr:uncharacterized protein LOC110024579 [Phalaenopsis equestris]
MAKLGPEASDPFLQPDPAPGFLSSTHPPPQDPHPVPYTLLPVFPGSHIRRRPQCCNYSSYLLISAAILALFGLTLFLIWPTDLDLHVARIRLDHVRVFTDPNDTISIDLRLRIRVRNPNFFSLHYDYVAVAIGYRSEHLGSVLAAGGKIRARGVSYVDAELRIDGIQVIHDVFYLIEDLVRGSIPLETVSEVKGLLHLIFFDVTIKVCINKA